MRRKQQSQHASQRNGKHVHLVQSAYPCIHPSVISAPLSLGAGPALENAGAEPYSTSNLEIGSIKGLWPLMLTNAYMGMASSHEALGIAVLMHSPDLMLLLSIPPIQGLTCKAPAHGVKLHKPIKWHHMAPIDAVS